MINRDSKKPSCFPVILFYQNTLPSHFYDTVLFLPNSAFYPPTPARSSNAYPKSCWTPCEAIYIPPFPKLFPSQIQSVLILGKFTHWGTILDTVIPWSLLRRYYPRESKKGIPSCTEGSLCIQQSTKAPGPVSLGFPQRK